MAVGLTAISGVAAGLAYKGKHVEGTGDIKRLALIEDAFETIAEPVLSVDVQPQLQP